MKNREAVIVLLFLSVFICIHPWLIVLPNFALFAPSWFIYD